MTITKILKITMLRKNHNSKLEKQKENVPLKIILLSCCIIIQRDKIVSSYIREINCNHIAYINNNFFYI